MEKMSEAARVARNNYMKAWRKKNPEKVAAIKARYWENKAKQIHTEEDQETEEKTQCTQEERENKMPI